MIFLLIQVRILLTFLYQYLESIKCTILPQITYQLEYLRHNL